MNKGKVMKHKLSAILMAFMLTTPAAFAAPEATNGTEATTGTTGTTTTTTGADKRAQSLLVIQLVAWLLALSELRQLSVWQRLLVWRRWQLLQQMTVAMAVLITPQPPRPLHANTALTRRN